MALIRGPFRAYVDDMTTRRTSPLLAGPDGRALLAASVLARLPLAMLSIAILVHVQRLTGSFAVAGVACSAYAICSALASPVLGRLVDRRGQTRCCSPARRSPRWRSSSSGLLPADTPPALLVALAGAAGLATPPLEACVRTLLPAIVSRPVGAPGAVRARVHAAGGDLRPRPPAGPRRSARCGPRAPPSSCAGC